MQTSDLVVCFPSGHAKVVLLEITFFFFVVVVLLVLGKHINLERGTVCSSKL